MHGSAAVDGAPLALGLAVATGDDEGEVELSVRPAEQAVAVDETVTFDIVVEGADGSDVAPISEGSARYTVENRGSATVAVVDD